MTRRKVTSHDVARAAGVSRATVSIVLNRSSSAVIGEETRKRVEAAAAELGYRPNSAARMLKSGATETVGLLISDDRILKVDGFIPILAWSIGRVIRQSGYHLLIESLSRDARGNPYTDLVESRRIDGLLVLNPRQDDTALSELVDGGFPVVLVGSIEHPREVSVRQSRAGLTAAVDHLVELGHRRVGHVAFSPPGYVASERRIRAFRTALAAHDLELADDAVVHGEFSAESGYRAALAMQAARPDLTAIFAGNDTIALGVMGALASLGLRVPADISVVGFDDLPFAGFVAPPLTTVRMDAELQGRLAAELLVARLRGQPIPEPRLMIPSTFVGRASTARARD